MAVSTYLSAFCFIFFLSFVVSEDGFKFAVNLKEDQNADQFAASHGFVNLGQIGALKGYYLFQLHSDHQRAKRDVQLDKISALQTSPHVLWMEEQVPKQRRRPVLQDEENN
eukprot:TRINITY_DN1019_c0_g1_i4.p1 TRINITY_DN1019_c0_g1~~TRINITY_DN1019_c0_g1_i4.p1  ORF type:complete len:111 (-),score=37.77 TRINITY_DN1019_c0_g1_i4:120-452(-)